MGDLDFVPFPVERYEAWLDEYLAEQAGIDAPLRGHDVDAVAAEERALRERYAEGPATDRRSLFAAVTDCHEVGWALVGTPIGEDPFLSAARLDDLDDGPALLDWLGGYLASRGSKRSLIWVNESSPTMRALRALRAWEPVATTMVIETGAAAESVVELRPLGQADLDAYLETGIEEYAAELVAGGTMTREAALEQSIRTHESLLPQGLASPGQHLLDVVADDRSVGMLWLAERGPKAAWIYDIVIDESVRGRGLGRAAMNAADHWCHERGRTALGLNVFGHNTTARTLYDSLGYRVLAEFLKHPIA